MARVSGEKHTELRLSGASTATSEPNRADSSLVNANQSRNYSVFSASWYHSDCRPAGDNSGIGSGVTLPLGMSSF